jgi:hypothetical protein
VITSLVLNNPLNLKRRSLASRDPNVYVAEFIEATNQQGQTGYGEVIRSRTLAAELAQLHLGLLESNRTLKFQHPKIPIAAMLETLDIPMAIGFVAQGFTTLKFKVGRDWEQEANALVQLRESIGPKIDIRLDANRAFSLEQAISFGKRIAHLKIAYFEEPLQDYRQIPDFYQATGIPVALDETLVECEQAPVFKGVSTYALKPFMMPDRMSIVRCLQTALEAKIDLAICSAFESPYSVNWLVVLAALWPDKLLPAGLSTVRWFKGEPFTPVRDSAEALKNLMDDLF